MTAVGLYKRIYYHIMPRPKVHGHVVCGNLYLRFADLPWVFGAFVEVNGSHFNINGFYINTMIFSNSVILFMEGIPFAIFQYCPALVIA